MVRAGLIYGQAWYTRHHPSVDGMTKVEWTDFRTIYLRMCIHVCGTSFWLCWAIGEENRARTSPGECHSLTLLLQRLETRKRGVHM